MPKPRSATSSPFRLGLLLFPGCMPAGLFATADLVRACNLRGGRERVAITWAAVNGGEIATQDGLSLKAQARVADVNCDAWLLPGLWLASSDLLEDAVRAQRPLIDALRALPRSQAIWSYCAGVALAAAAGRLDGRSATATWWLQPALAVRFPRVKWQGSPELVVSRDVITASGPSGYLPLMLDRLAQHFPADVLRDVQEVLMLPTPHVRHAAFQPVEMMALTDPGMRALLLWAQQTPAQDVALAEAARQRSVSVRTLCRQVQQATGLAAGDWLRRAKLSQAADALRGTRTPIKTISEQLGFGSDASFYRAFRSATGMTPAEYRQVYGVLARGMVASRA